MGDSCCFFGHRDAAESIRAKLKEEIIRLIEEHDVNDYYIGNQGGFDSLVLSVMKELAVSYPQIRYTIVLAYLPDEKSVISETNTIYPEGLESVPKRFCIARRNDWSLKRPYFSRNAQTRSLMIIYYFSVFAPRKAHEQCLFQSESVTYHIYSKTRAQGYFLCVRSIFRRTK